MILSKSLIFKALNDPDNLTTAELRLVVPFLDRQALKLREESPNPAFRTVWGTFREPPDNDSPHLPFP